MALIVDLLSQGLSGKGRANNEPPGALAQCAYIQVIDPQFFAGLDAFIEQADWLTEACRSSPPATWNKSGVRMPGDSAARKRREALQQGVPVNDADLAAIMEHAVQLSVATLPPMDA